VLQRRKTKIYKKGREKMVAGSIIECRKKKKEREGKKGVKAPLHPLTSLFFLAE